MGSGPYLGPREVFSHMDSYNYAAKEAQPGENIN